MGAIPPLPLLPPFIDAPVNNKNIAKPTGCPGAGRCGGIEDVICAIGGGASTMISGTSSTVTPSDAQWFQIAKTRQKLFKKIREIVCSYLCLQHFDKI